MSSCQMLVVVQLHMHTSEAFVFSKIIRISFLTIIGYNNCLWFHNLLSIYTSLCCKNNAKKL